MSESKKKEKEAPLVHGCLICDGSMDAPRKTEITGVVRCPSCGAPSRVLKNGNLESAILTDWIEPTRALWLATGSNVAPGYGFSQESVKDGVAGDRDRAAIRAWFRKNRKSMPPSYASWGRDEDRRFA